MLDELHVENLGIIESATIEPGPGLVAVTGETGAGKTLLLGALRLLRGDTARTDRVGPHGDEARVQGRFVLADEEVVAERRVGGRSRAYLDGSMVPAKALSERFAGTIEIVAQHEHVALGREASLRGLLDQNLDDTGREARETYHRAYGELRALIKEAEALGGDERSLARELDLLRHQAAEIEGAGPTGAEDEELTALLRRLRHAEEIAEGVRGALDAIEPEDRAEDLLRRAFDELRSAAKRDPELDGLAGRLESIVADVQDIASEARQFLGELDLTPGALQQAEERAAVLADLKRKYGATIPDVLEFADQAAARADELERLLGRAESISAEIAAARQHAVEAGARLAESRRDAAEALGSAATGILGTLGFRSPVVRITVSDAEPSASGADKVGLVFASDQNLTPGPVSKIASGGELSRLVLAIRVATGVADAPVVAFDEVDAGVGGATALAMGEQLANLARTGQVLVVTHLPQVAAYADAHFVVERLESTAMVRRVEGQERLAELARMLGGIEESERGQLHAEELLAHAERRRDR